MSTQRQALLLIGSPKVKKSTSASIGNYLLALLGKKGLRTESLRINAMLKSDESRNKLWSIVNNSEIVILSCPLYVDNLPSFVIEAMELILEQRKSARPIRRQQLLAILNCGYPEPEQNAVAIDICKQFAQESGFDWAGGLAFGMGVAIDGHPLEAKKYPVGNIKKSLVLTADALICQKPLPKQAVELMAKPIMPVWFYVWFMDAICKLKTLKTWICGIPPEINEISQIADKAGYEDERGCNKNG